MSNAPYSCPGYSRLSNPYVRCSVGYQGNFKSNAFFDDGTDGRGDKIFDPKGGSHTWNVSGRWGVEAILGDPEIQGSKNTRLNFLADYPCHYFGFWKLKIGKDMRMIGDSTGAWYQENTSMPVMTPTSYDAPPPDLLDKEPALGRTGPFIRGTWTTKGGNGSEIRTEITVHLVRDMVKFEYRLTNYGNATEKVGFEQVCDVETGLPLLRTGDDGGYYGQYDNACYAYMPGVGATTTTIAQSGMMFGGSEVIKTANTTKIVPRTAVPDWVQYYDSVSSPICYAKSILNEEDATKPDFLAAGEYNDLYHKDLWIGDTGTGYNITNQYMPDKLHSILDMAWVLCWDQKDLRPGQTRTIITYYGVGAATSRWTTSVGKNVVPDSAVAAVQAPYSLKYDSTTNASPLPEIAPPDFTVSAYVYNLATDPGPYDLSDVTATISLPPGLELVNDPKIAPDNTETKQIGFVAGNSESDPVTWQVTATGQYTGELPIYVYFVDNTANPNAIQWMQTVQRNVYVPAVKRGVFHYGWQLMNVPFDFNDYRVAKVFQLSGAFGAKYWDPKRNNYFQVDQVKPGQGFWINVGVNTWGATQPFFLTPTASIVGAVAGSGTQTLTQSIPLSKGWNMIGNPFVYPIYWGQVLVYSSTQGGQTVTLDTALVNKWLSTTLFSWNPDKFDYDTSSSRLDLLDPWKGYWVYAYQPITLILRAPLMPGGDVTANPGGQ